MHEARMVAWAEGWSPEQFRAAVEAAGGLERDAVMLLDCWHDDWCPKLEDGACECEPDVVATIWPTQGAA